ncbi:hypothetical protein BKA81DRAFT_367291 [Phyllosticta paracitricarpa]
MIPPASHSTVLQQSTRILPIPSHPLPVLHKSSQTQTTLPHLTVYTLHIAPPSFVHNTILF